MNFCSNCGNPVTRSIPDGDDRLRYVCRFCGMIHYQNPKMVVGCIPELDGRILLCKRAIEPRLGKWTLPAGYLENNETVAGGAVRETWEEARARVKNLVPFGIFNLAFVSQVYLMFRSDLADSNFRAGDESLEVELFRENDIPWEEMAFPVIEKTLGLFFKDRKAGAFPFHMEDIQPENLDKSIGED